MKSITDVSPGVSRIKSAKGVKLRAAPKKSKDTAYLDLFLLNNEKTRLKQEQSHLAKQQERNRKRLEELEAEIESAMKMAREHSEGLEKGGVSPPKRKLHPRKQWQKMPLNY